MSENDRFEYRGYWLAQRGNSDKWYIAWYDKSKGGNRYRSTRTSDFQLAQDRLIEYVAEVTGPGTEKTSPDKMTMNEAFLIYWEQKGNDTKAFANVRRSLAYWREFPEFNKGEVAVSAADALSVGRFAEWLMETKGLKLGYASTIISHGRAAFNHCKKIGYLTAAPYVPEIRTADDVRNAEPKGPPLSLDQLALLFDVADPHHLDMLMLLTNTMCRPDAACDLTRPQIDFNDDFIMLNPPGRKQTRKYRPIVPITETLMWWLQRRCNDGRHQMVNWKGNRIASHCELFKTMRKRIAKDDTKRLIMDVQPTAYSIRHTMARELRRRRVPNDEISIMLGHKVVGLNDTTGIYSPYDPDYCINAREAIDDVMNEMQKRTDVQITKPSYTPDNVVSLRRA